MSRHCGRPDKDDCLDFPNEPAVGLKYTCANDPYTRYLLEVDGITKSGHLPGLAAEALVV